MIDIIRYIPEYKLEWDAFVKKSKNGVFIFCRDYMEYHRDHFEDHSLLFYEDGNLIAAMPANSTNTKLISHEGLTFGGIVSDNIMCAEKMIGIFEALWEYMKKSGIHSFYYKAIPHIYHSIPSEEDSYAMFINRFKLVRRDLSSTIDMNNMLDFSKTKRQIIKKAQLNNITVGISQNYKEYFEIVAVRLDEKYNAIPTHSSTEMEYLANKFPENIKLYCAYHEGEMIGGVIIYISRNVVHSQYIAANETGMEYGCVAMILEQILAYYKNRIRYFDFGISTEKNGYYLNTGLVFNKESFGARSIVYDQYYYKV